MNKPGGGRILATKERQISLTVGEEVGAMVDLRDLSACSVVLHVNAENKLASVILPEPLASLDNDGNDIKQQQNGWSKKGKIRAATPLFLKNVLFFENSHQS